MQYSIVLIPEPEEGGYGVIVPCYHVFANVKVDHPEG